MVRATEFIMLKLGVVFFLFYPVSFNFDPPRSTGSLDLYPILNSIPRVLKCLLVNVRSEGRGNFFFLALRLLSAAAAVYAFCTVALLAIFTCNRTPFLTLWLT